MWWDSAQSMLRGTAVPARETTLPELLLVLMESSTGISEINS